jgi:arylsulfatase A-like enzyme
LGSQDKLAAVFHSPLRGRWLASLLCLTGVAWLGCRGPDSGPAVVRLGSQLVTGSRSKVPLPVQGSLGPEPRQVSLSLEADRVAHLVLRARGTASILHLDWRLQHENRFKPYRRLSIPLFADRQEHRYRINLQREPYWIGTIAGLRLSLADGELELLEMEGESAGSPYRDMALAGSSLPSLPGATRAELILPDTLPRQVWFDTHLGLVPEYDRNGVEARFLAFTETEGGKRCAVWLDESIRGSGKGSRDGWRPIRRPVSVRPSCRLILEVEARRNGTRLPSGVAMWGNPMLLSSAEARGRKNLVLIVVDTLRADALGAHGGLPGITPHLDSFAAQAIRFDALFAPAPWTLPTVASLLSGLHPQTHGAGTRLEGFAPTGLPEAAKTLAEALAENGYVTSGIYNNIYLNTAFGLQQGFDRYRSYEEQATVMVDRALEELTDLRDRPFFLLLHLFDPHNPYQPPETDCREILTRTLGSSAGGDLRCSVDRRPNSPIPPPHEHRWIEALYRAEVAYTDREIGRFLRGMEDLELVDSTFVAIVSDHGEEFWERLPQEEQLGYQIDGDHGHTHYTELLRLVGMIRGPGLRPRTVQQPVEIIDLYPTLLHLLAVEPPPSQGRDLRPSFSGQRLTPPLLLSDFLLYGPTRWSVTQGRWKLVIPEDRTLDSELFDLESDPREKVNLALSRRDLVARMSELGRRERHSRERARAQFLLGEEALSATYLEWRHITKLRALGYLK